jgi:integrase
MFTDKTISNLKPKATRYEVLEGGTGLAIRVTPRGVKTFQFLYRHGGKPRRMTLSIYRPAGLANAPGAAAHDAHGVPYVTLADARVKLAEARKMRDGGVDPGGKAVASHAAERQAQTVGELCDVYLQRWAEPNKRKSSTDADRGQIERDIRPQWGNRKVSSIQRTDCIALLDDIVARGAPIMANRTKALLSKMFRVAVRRGIIPYSPVLEIDLPGGKEVPRQREPNPDELRLIWRAADRLEPPWCQFVKLLVLLGQRRGEVGAMRDAEIVDDDWLLPAERMKGKVAQLIPLPKLALDLIASTPRDRDSDYVIPSRTIHGKHLTAYSDVKKALDAAIRDVQREEAGAGPVPPPLPPWTFHDLRRSFSSGLARLGVGEEIRERLLAHLPERLKRVYNVYDYRLEKRHALQLWERRLAEIVSRRESNVTTLKRA